MSITTISQALAKEHAPIVMQSPQDDLLFSGDANSLGLMNLEMTSTENLDNNWEECALTEDACVASFVTSIQGMELWTTFQSYVADHQSSTPADDSNIEDLAIGEEAPTIE